jgi:glucosamine kinase
VGKPGYFVGVDGGATRCRSRLRDASGRALAQCVGPAANIYVNFSLGLEVVREIVERTMGEAGLASAARDQIGLGLGLAGLSNAADAFRVTSALPGWARVEAVNDAVIACIGASGLADGGLVIAGTGSAGVARVGGTTTIIGGRGFLLGDDGAGARIGADALRAALHAHDGLEPMTNLSRALLAHFKYDPLAMIHWALDAKPSDYGAFAPRVFEAAGAGEAGAKNIVEAAARAIAALTRAVIALGTENVALVGGVAEPLRKYLPKNVAERLQAPRHDAVDGAILLVGGVVPVAGGSG